MKTSLEEQNPLVQKIHVGAVGFAVLTILLTSCNTPQPQTEPDQGEGATTEQAQPTAATGTGQPQAAVNNASVKDIAQNPDAFTDKTWSLRGQVIERLDGNLVRLRGDSLYTGEEVLAVLPDEFIFPNNPNVSEKIQVTGKVWEFTPAVAQALNLGIPASDYADYEGAPLVVAEMAGLSPTFDELLSDPQVFYTNQPIAMEGQLEELGPNTYRLAEGGLDGAELLVVYASPLEPRVQNADKVVVTGEAQPFDLNTLQAQYSWQPELQEEVAQKYADQPFIQALGVYPMSEE